SNAGLDRQFHVVAASFQRQGMKTEKLTALNNDQRRRLLYNYQLDADTGEPQIGEPGFVAALKLLLRLRRCQTPSNITSAAAFQAGKAMMGLVPLREIPALHRIEEQSAVKLGICRIPGSMIVFDGKRSIEEKEGNFSPYLGSDSWLAGITPEMTG